MRLRFLVFVGLVLVTCKGFSFQEESSARRYLDSSETYLNSDVPLSRVYFDSIVNPSESNLKEDIAYYYFLKGKHEYEEYGIAASIQNYIKSLSYSEKYENYELAGLAAGEISSYFYNSNKDSIAEIYYNKAFDYYTKIKDQHGLLDLMQFPAYAKYANNEMQESIDLVLKDLETYKNVEGDKMYYSFAIFLLTSNYLHLNDIDNAHKYNTIYKSLNGHEFIEPYYYLKYENAIKTCFSEYYFENENLDSIKYYLDAIQIEKGGRDFYVQRDLFENYLTYYKLTGNTTNEKAYADSLEVFNEDALQSTMKTSVEVNDDLSKASLELSTEVAAKRKTTTVVYVLLVIAAILITLVIIYFRKNKNRAFAFSELKARFSSLKVKQEKLAIKNIEFEEFLNSLKKEVKRISSINSQSDLKSSINSLYKEIHLNNSNFVNSEDHYTLLSAMNESFFLHMERDFPNLDTLEVQITYYIYSGFKNKEIAMFTNRSLRAIEGKRYRIAKKLKFDSKSESLKDFLERSFKD